MTVQYSVAVRNAMLEAIETTAGSVVTLELRSGPAPANCAAADSGSVLASITLPADWMANAASAAKAKAGSWIDASADAAGVLEYFRLKDSGGVCHVQGSITALNAGGDMQANALDVQLGQRITVSTFVISAGDAPPPAEPPPEETGKYRPDQWTLFQDSSWATDPARLPGGSSRTTASWARSPNFNGVDRTVGWNWDQGGGDYLSPTGVRNGTASASYWATVAVATGSALPPASYNLDVLAVVQKCMTENRWLALKLRSTNFSFKLRGKFSATPPILRLTYSDASTEDLYCITTANANTTGDPIIHISDISTPIFTEFVRPKNGKVIVAANLNVTVAVHPTSNSSLGVQLVDPPQHDGIIHLGCAQESGLNDQGIESVPGVIGAHIYYDTLPESTWKGDTDVFSLSVNSYKKTLWDPYLWGAAPAPDPTKYPTRQLGKWLSHDNDSPGDQVPGPGGQTNNRFSIKKSNEIAPFSPLLPGVGAMYMTMPSSCYPDGALVKANSGDSATNSWLLLPEPYSGLLQDMYVRCYCIFGLANGGPWGPWLPTDTKQVYWGSTSSIAWANTAGKAFWPSPGFNPWMGFGGGSGGGYASQMRGSWEWVDYNNQGPDESGIQCGFHLFDYSDRNPISYSGTKAFWGQIDGKGACFYPYRWYCIEQRFRMNTVRADGTWDQDGILQAWIDGYLVYSKTNFVNRTLPPATYSDSTAVQPYRELGHNALMLNWFTGGVVGMSLQGVRAAMTNLVYSTRYIGPMRTV